MSSWRTSRIRLAPSDVSRSRFCRRGAREHQARDVGAGDEQDEADRRREQPQRAVRRGADDPVEQRIGEDAEAGIGGRMLLGAGVRQSRPSRLGPTESWPPDAFVRSRPARQTQ